MKHTGNVTTVLAITAQFIVENGFWYPTAFYYALFVGKHYGVGLTNHEFVIRLCSFLEVWKEGENG